MTLRQRVLDFNYFHDKRVIPLERFSCTTTILEAMVVMYRRAPAVSGFPANPRTPRALLPFKGWRRMATML